MENDEISDLEEAEERLYAQVYHDNNSIEFDTSAVENPVINSNKSIMRYWQDSKQNQQSKKQLQKLAANRKKSFIKLKNPPPPKDEETEPKQEPTEASKKFFVPYSSVLSFKTPTASPEKTNSDNSNGATNYEKKSKAMKFPKDKKSDRASHKQLMKTKYAAKVIKAEKVRQKVKKNEIQSIAIESSSEDEVVHVPLKPPPVINLDSSEDEGKINKKTRKRAVSPSSSSMISDDFIVGGDRNRLIANFPLASQQSNVINDRLIEVLSEKEKMKKIKNLTRVSSSSSNSNSARSSCERGEQSTKEKGKKRKSQGEDTTTDTVYTSKAKSSKKKKQQPSESSDDEQLVQKTPKSNKKRRKSTASRKKSTDDNKSDEDKDPKLEMISNAIKKRKKSSQSETVVEAPKEDEKIEEAPLDDDVELVVTPADPIYEITDDEELEHDSDESMKNFRIDVECDLSLNVTEANSEPHELNFNHVDLPRALSQEELDCEVGWNDEMKYFYNECSYGRDFSVTEILNSMPKDANLWQINKTDQVRMKLDRDKRIRCRNCNEMGHIAVQCRRPKKRIVCIMCGQEGHRETRCPNSICLRCGRPNRVYSSACSNCYNSARQLCEICGYKGHTLNECPDKWRRYHSTTDYQQQELDTSFTVNPRKFCSICSQRGHFAEQCRDFNKTLAGLITSSPIKIVSNKKTYNHEIIGGVRNHQVLQLMTYMDTYKFKFKLPSNCRIYPRFLDMFKNHQFEIFKKLQALFRGPAKKQENESAVIEEIKEGAQRDESKAVVLRDDSNSNYSFTDFYRNDENDAPNFISFQDTSNRIPTPPVDTVSDAKIMLTKDHATLLMSTKGQNYIYDLGIRFNVISQFRWDSTGNSLLIQGFGRDQENFHTEIKNYLSGVDLENHARKTEQSSQVPRVRSKAVSYLQIKLRECDNINIKDTWKNLMRMVDAERVMDIKKVLKFRKILNITFMGIFELRQGGFHKAELEKILNEQKQEIVNGNGEAQIDKKLRDEINEHVRYIFSAINHGNYHEMYTEHKRKVTQQKQEKKQPNQ